MFEPVNLFGSRMQQTQAAIFAWGKVIKDREVCRIVEIGTGTGVFSCYLLAEMLEREGQFQTWNLGPLQNTGPVAKRLGLADHFKMGNVFEHVDAIGRFVKRKGVSAIFCDGGNKPKELKTFARELKLGDVIGVHDWGWEPSFSDTHGLPLRKLPESMIDPLTAFFERIPG